MDPQTMNQNSSNKTWYIIGAVIVALALWYFLSVQSPAGMETSSDNTTAAISDELDQIPDDSATLNQDAAVSAQSVSGF